MQVSDLSLETADRVLDRYERGVVTFRAMNAEEEKHVIAALHYYRKIALMAVDVAAENLRAIEELDGFRQRAVEGMKLWGE